MKKTLLTALFFGVPYSLLMIGMKSIMNGGINKGIVGGAILAGIIFGLLFAYGLKYFASKLYGKITIELEPTENLIMEGGANHFRGKEGVGGKLALTNDRLIFKSHKLNVQNHEQVFHLHDIESVAETKTLGLIKNGLTLQMKTSESHRFVVDSPTEWARELSNRIN